MALWTPDEEPQAPTFEPESPWETAAAVGAAILAAAALCLLFALAR